MKHLARVVAAAAFLGAALLATASPQAAPTPFATPSRLDEALPFDAAVRMGHLPNGLTYYIRRNGRPENRVSLRLAVKAGSVLEEEDQRGLARSREWPVRSLCSGRPCISSTA